ncbi:hypothetical protein OG592_06535 [Streptomyces avidinii]|uniref:hypothetical protein n=1 Tax=Streptomyces avidinii TaxID=1895 RepID=UPI003863F0E4|nr:hypothetical protein OG592_06535 [Streptomyces avidinii]
MTVFRQGGYLSWLEVCSWSDDIKVHSLPRIAGCSHDLDPERPVFSARHSHRSPSLPRLMQSCPARGGTIMVTWAGNGEG